MNGRRPAQTLRKDGGIIETAVAIRILQPLDLSAMLFAVRIIIHLNDEEPPVRVECKRDWIGDKRFRGNKFEVKALPELKGVQGIPPSHRWESR
jgi:hypothetical protein